MFSIASRLLEGGALRPFALQLEGIIAIIVLRLEKIPGGEPFRPDMT